MKLSVRIVQIIVALLFIVSGLVKANDPLGLSYKMQEFFELWSEGFSKDNFIAGVLTALHKSSLALSITMITLEIMAGVALLLGWKKKIILWLLLMLILFFTFLTGYAYLSGRFTNCGCFGDCLPITPLASFIKDIILLVMILFLVVKQKHIPTILSSRGRLAVLIGSLVFSLLLQWYVLNYLPIADCLPFKEGNNIATQMKPPVGSRPDSIVIKYIYEKQGKRYEWAANELPADFNTYKYIDRIDKVVRKGNAEPPIKGFSLVGVSGSDSAQAILSQPFAVLVFVQEYGNTNWMTDFKKLTNAAKVKGLVVYVGSPDLNKTSDVFVRSGITNTQFFNVDFTAVRTVARTSPTILFLQNGTIVHKYSKKEITKAAEALSEQPF